MATHPRLQFHEGSILQGSALERVVPDSDVIFHLAAAVGVRLVIEDPVRTIETNVRGTDAVLAVAARHNVRTLVASSSEVYGKSTRERFREDDDLILGPTERARWSYACSKATAEFLAIAYHRQFGLPTQIVRLFNTVGPRQVGHYGMVIPRLVRQALAGQDLTVFGDGTQSRCFTHVADVVDALLALAALPRAQGDVFNLGSENHVSIRDLAERILQLTGSRSKIVFIPYDEAYAPGFEDMQRRAPDLARIRAAIGYAPRHSLDDILRAVIAFERERGAAAPA